jgi:hypothetical protein
VTKTKTKTKPEAAKTKNAMSNHLRKYRANYQPTLGVANRGSLDNGDEVATALRTLEPKQVAAIAELALGLKKGELVKKYGHLNPGQVRMNSGNKIRNAVKRGDLSVAQVKAAIKKVA